LLFFKLFIIVIAKLNYFFIKKQHYKKLFKIIISNAIFQ